MKFIKQLLYWLLWKVFRITRISKSSRNRFDNLGMVIRCDENFIESEG